VVIHDIKKKVLPEVDDALAQKLGSFKSIQELKDRISSDITNQKKSDQKRKNQEDCISWLIDQNPVEAPESLVANQMQNLAVDAGMQLSQMGLDEKAIEEQLKNWANEMQERANRQVRASLLLSAIARQEKIQATNEDLRQEIVRIAVQSNKKPQEVLSDIQDRGLMSGLVKQITELKALEWVLEQPEG
jgi:trigger factor